LVSISKKIKSYTDSLVTVFENGIICYKGTPIHSSLTKRIVEQMKEGFPFEHMIKFLENLYENPSSNSIEQLYSFLEHKGLPITDDGHFLAYKAVRNDYYDKYSGTISNAIGSYVEMERRNVSDKFTDHCASGLHCGAIDYVKNYANSPTDKILVVKVNPKDAVSVPNDHNFTKLRVCRYLVLSELENAQEIFTESVVVTEVPSQCSTDVNEEDALDNSNQNCIGYDKYAGYLIGTARGSKHGIKGTYKLKGSSTPEFARGYNDGYNTSHFLDGSKKHFLTRDELNFLLDKS